MLKRGETAVRICLQDFRRIGRRAPVPVKTGAQVQLGSFGEHFQEILPRCRLDGLSRAFPVGPNDHCGFGDLIGIVRFHNVQNIESPKGGKAILPGYLGALFLDLFGYGLGKLVEFLWVVECQWGHTTENNVGGHFSPLPKMNNGSQAVGLSYFMLSH